MLSLSLPQARALHLAALGLLHKPRIKPTKATVLATIAQMQLLQIDTINVVARSPYLVLFSRLGAYPSCWIEELLAEGAIFEGWAHEACFIPVEDYPLHRFNATSRPTHWMNKQARRLHDEHRDEMDRLLDRVRTSGPVKASDFRRTDGKGSGWWSWKIEKRWLEAWFALGELMISARENFHRVYDVSERVIGRKTPNWRALGALSQEELQRQFILKSVRALGITQARWVSDYFRSGRKHKDADLAPLVDAGELKHVAVHGWEEIGYVHRDWHAQAELAASGKLRATHTTLLSPFDPLVWDRARAKTMFGFEYTLECYTPAPKRRYGYFALPILYRGRLIGRLDAKAHRRQGVFEIKTVFLEPDIAVGTRLLSELAGAIQSCAEWHKTPQIVVKKTQPSMLAGALRRVLRLDE